MVRTRQGGEFYFGQVVMAQWAGGSGAMPVTGALTDAAAISRPVSDMICVDGTGVVDICLRALMENAAPLTGSV